MPFVLSVYCLIFRAVSKTGAAVNKFYFEHRVMNHAEGSLEALIQKSLGNKLNSSTSRKTNEKQSKKQSKNQTWLVIKKASVEGRGGDQNTKLN